MLSIDEKNNIDQDGYRKNVGIVVCNVHCQVLWARRVRHDGWQFPQGGVHLGESATEAVFRELQEEIGLQASDVCLLGSTEKWLKYDVPYLSKASSSDNCARPFRGQKQRWFLFRLLAEEFCVRLDTSATPEFDQWRWVEYWQPLQHIVAFKKLVYQQALTELAPLLQLDGQQVPSK